MEKENSKCYACGVDCTKSGFVITYGVLGGAGLCRSCVNKGISVHKVSYEKLKEPAPVTQAEYEEAGISFAENFNQMVNGLIPSDVSSAFWKLNIAIGKIYRWNLERTKSPIFEEESGDE